MSFVLLIACPRCRNKFSQLSDEPMAAACPLCRAVFTEAEYGQLRYRAHLVARELEKQHHVLPNPVTGHV
jgi:ribosomal protein S27E